MPSLTALPADWNARTPTSSGWAAIVLPGVPIAVSSAGLPKPNPSNISSEVVVATASSTSGVLFSAVAGRWPTSVSVPTSGRGLLRRYTRTRARATATAAATTLSTTVTVGDPLGEFELDSLSASASSSASLSLPSPSRSAARMSAGVAASPRSARVAMAALTSPSPTLAAAA